jgi:hypothetical protein
MASVFLSYDHDDRARAAPIADGLEKAGHLVWWDFHVHGGAQFSKVIEEALKEAEAVVVLWSRNAIESAWVRDEAAAGRDSGRLIPVSLDETAPPLGFRQFQTIDLSGWSGRGKPAQLKTILEAVECVAHGGAASVVGPAPMPARSIGWPGHRLSRWRALCVTLLLGGVILLLGVVFARPWESKTSVPLVAVAAADKSAESDGLARDQLAKLGAMRGATMDTVRLASADVGKPGDADLIFEASAGTDSQKPQASLTLRRRMAGFLL